MKILRKQPAHSRGYRPKGFAATSHRSKAMGKSIFSEVIDYPIAVLTADEMDSNSREMMDYCQRNGFLIAPHGKTYMAPTLLEKQLADGVWGFSATSNWQMRTLYSMGVNRIILTNEIVNSTAIKWIAETQKKNKNFELMIYVDSVDGVKLLESTLVKFKLAKPIDVLIEIGFLGGRGGARSKETAIEVALAVSKSNYLRLRGVSGFEGIALPPENGTVLDGVNLLLDLIVNTAKELDSLGCFAKTQEIVLSAGGSNFFDRAVDKFSPVSLSKPIIKILRAGCYLTHDDGDTSPDDRVTDSKLDLPHFQPALHVWGEVLSIPEPTRAIVGIGRRDASFDLSMPVPKFIRRRGSDLIESVAGMSTHTMNDQHLYLNLSKETKVNLGDLISFGIVHPCTTFDKWRTMVVVDSNYRIVSIIDTYF
jgi:D-serine dehydratase